MTITAVRSASVYVTDQTQAVEFYTKTLGFSVKARFPLGQGEGVELVPPGGNTGIVLLPKDQADGAQTPKAHLMLRCSDPLMATQDLKAKGVRFRQEPVQMPWGYVVAQFEDLDGNGLGLTNQPF